MTIREWLLKASQQLSMAGITTARLDSLVLAEDVLSKDRTHLLAHPERELTKEQQGELQKLIDRRAQHEPLAYIRGKTEFYGREFVVTPDVLEPRPESETIIELLKSNVQHPASIVDVGTGSGALAITAKLEVPEATVFAIDIDPKCLKVAQQNAQKQGVNIECIQGDLLESFTLAPSPSPLAVLANLPYVPDDYQINEAAGHEPKLALFGGPDGLDFYRTMFQQLAKFDVSPIFVLTESLPFQHEELASIARTQNFTQIAQQDFIQVFKTI